MHYKQIIIEIFIASLAGLCAFLSLRAYLLLIISKLKKTMADLTALSTAVDTLTTAANSAITLLNTIPGLIATIPTTDQAAVDAITQKITDETNAITAAVTADTPAS